MNILRVKEASVARVLMHRGTTTKDFYGLCARDRRRIVRHGINWCRSGCSLGRALGEMERLARSLFMGSGAII